MKQVKICALMIILTVALVGCTHDIALHQQQAEIVQINLVYSPFGENEVLYTLTGEEIQTFLDKLLELKLHKNSGPQDIGGTLFVQIIYSDASEELLGTASVGYTSNGTLEHDGWYYLAHDDLFALFSEYIDLSSLPGM